jgi:hypothetical protein
MALVVGTKKGQPGHLESEEQSSCRAPRNMNESAVNRLTSETLRYTFIE